MNIETTMQQEKRWVELIFLWQVIRRQRVFILTSLVLILILAFSYALLRPVSWQSRASIFVGEATFFQVNEIERPDEIRYRYSKDVVAVPMDVVINPIRNTRIIEIRVTEATRSLAILKIKKIISEIIRDHKEILEHKRAEFVKIMNVVNWGNVDKTELLKLLDNASASVLTRQVGEVVAEEDTHGPRFIKMVGVGLFFGIVIIMLLALIKDSVSRKSK